MDEKIKFPLMGLDVGDIRVGVAVSDALGISITPLPVQQRAKNEAEQKIVKLIAERGIETVVVGLPLNEDNAETEQSMKVRNFCRRLSKRIKIHLVYTDEYGSSLAASEILGQGPKSERRSEEPVDSVAAAVILQDFIKQFSP